MFLECITVCEFYGDYLRHTLPQNRRHFDHFVVVTTELDRETISLCQQWDVEYVLTHRLRQRNGDLFNKGRAINDGLVALHRKDWMLHLDADMVLPSDFREVLEKSVLDQEIIYGTPRYECNSAARWLEYMKHPAGAHRFPISNTRPRQLAVGYFQLFHARASALAHEPWYPEEWGHAGRSDRYFYRKWRSRGRLPNVIPIHLHHATVEGENWRGRVTPRFGEGVVGMGG